MNNIIKGQNCRQGNQQIPIIYDPVFAGVLVMAGCMFCTFTGRQFLSPYFTSPINAGVLAMVLGLVLVPLVSLLTPKPDRAAVEEMFSCYSHTVRVPASTALEEKEA